MRLSHLLVTLFFISCNLNQVKFTGYLHDPSISSSQGILIDSSSFFVPIINKKGNTIHETVIDSSQKRKSNAHIWQFIGPILYNYFSGKEIYRLYFGGFKVKPICITFTHYEDKYFISSKSIEYYDDTSRIKKHIPQSIQPWFGEKVIYNYKDIEISSNEWKELENLLTTSNFWENPTTNINEGILDGSGLTLEAHLKNRYYFNKTNQISDTTITILNHFLKSANFDTLVKIN